jgi:TRAP-type C4-dicarboxylate transport system permease small subunit
MCSVKILDYIDRAAVVIAVVAILAMTLLVTASVIGRYFFSMPIPGDLVLSEFLMVFVAFLPLAAVQASREHVFVTIFTDWMRNNTKVVLEAIGVVIGLLIFTILAAATFTDFFHAWSVGTYTEGEIEFPEAPPRFVVFLGLALLAVRLLVDAIASVRGLRTGEAAAARSEADRALDIRVPE